MDGFSEVFHRISTIRSAPRPSSPAHRGVANATFIFVLPGSPGACKDAWDGILKAQLDYRHMPCNFVEIMPRLDEHLRRAMDKILISACLLGAPVRYDGKGKLLAHPLIDTLAERGAARVLLSGTGRRVPDPAPSAEIAAEATGDAVLAGEGRVVDVDGADVPTCSWKARGRRCAIARDEAVDMRC